MRAPPLAVALRWVTQQGVVAVTSSDEAAHISGDLASFDFDLTTEEIERLSKVQMAAGVAS